MPIIPHLTQPPTNHQCNGCTACGGGGKTGANNRPCPVCGGSGKCSHGGGH